VLGEGTFWHLQMVLTMYPIYHTGIHPLNDSPSSPSTHSRNSFNRYHFSIYIHVYTIFSPYSPSFTISPLPLPSHWYQPSSSQTEPVPSSHSLILYKKKGKRKKNDIFVVKIAI
jgi:hypothetical protein